MLTAAIFALSFNTKANIIIFQNTPIQYNMHFDDGFYYGLSATTGYTTIPYPAFPLISSLTVNPGHVWSVSCSCIPPVDYVTVGETIPMALSTNIYGSMTTPFIVRYFEHPLTGDIHIDFL